MSPERLVHHELCFGCGRTNLFGLLMEIEATGEGRVRGRGFVKQDHQGPVRGFAHPGVIAAALSEAITFAVGHESELSEVQLRVKAPLPVGAFVEVESQVVTSSGGAVEATATAWVDGQEVASARGACQPR